MWHFTMGCKYLLTICGVLIMNKNQVEDIINSKIERFVACIVIISAVLFILFMVSYVSYDGGKRDGQKKGYNIGIWVMAYCTQNLSSEECYKIYKGRL